MALECAPQCRGASVQVCRACGQLLYRILQRQQQAGGIGRHQLRDAIVCSSLAFKDLVDCICREDFPEIRGQLSQSRQAA